MTQRYGLDCPNHAVMRIGRAIATFRRDRAQTKQRQMVVRTDLFPDGLVRAIDNWQAGSKDKARKARRLHDWSRDLPLHYREAPVLVFRQVRVNAQLSMGVAAGAIPEAVSSWTTSMEVARRFREEDQDRNKIIMIFARRPTTLDVILNLNAIYAEVDFLDTVAATSERLGRRFAGIERWQGTQNEVVLKETTIRNDEIVSLGAFRQLNDVVPVFDRLDPNAPSDDEIFRNLTGRGPDEHFWTSQESAANGVRNAADHVRNFLVEKRLWPNQLPH